MIRQALTIAALSAVTLTPIAASAQPRGHDRGGGYGRDRGGYDRGGFDRGGPPGRQGFDNRRYDSPRGGPDRGDPRDYRRNAQPCRGGGGGGGIIGAIAGGLLGNGANGRAIERYDGRGC